MKAAVFTSGLEAQGYEGLWHVPACSSGLKKALPQDLPALKRLLQGLEASQEVIFIHFLSKQAKSESDALRFSQRQRLAFQELRAPGAWRAPFQPAPQLTVTPWSSIHEHLAAGDFTLEDAQQVYEHLGMPNRARESFRGAAGRA